MYSGLLRTFTKINSTHPGGVQMYDGAQSPSAVKWRMRDFKAGILEKMAEC